MYDKFKEIKKLFAAEKNNNKKNNKRNNNKILLAYIFGSQLKGKTGPLSDFDFAVLLSQKPSFRFKYELKNKIANIINSGKVDLIILNEAPIELKYHVVASGKIIYQKNSLIKTEFEADTLSRYFDYLPTLRAQKQDILNFRPEGAIYTERIQRYRAALAKTEEMLAKIRAN